MTTLSINPNTSVLVAIDVAKNQHEVLIEYPNGTRKRMKVKNTLASFRSMASLLKKADLEVMVGLEPTGHYHRPLAYFLLTEGFRVRLISSVAAARTREARYNSWDKNDPKDAQVILHMMKQGMTQIYYDPVVNNFNGIKELSDTYHYISLRKTQAQHRLLTHYLPLYFPEADKYFCTSRGLWFPAFFEQFPCPSSIVKYTFEEFSNEAWSVSGKKVSKTIWLKDVYETAKNSIALPINEDDQAVVMFRVSLNEYGKLCFRRKEIEKKAELYLQDNKDFHRLKSIPGIGPIISLIILAEAGDLRRFKHSKQFLKFCGFDLCTHQSGMFRGKTKLSKRGKSKLRQAFWLGATIAIRQNENTFRKRFHHYIKDDSNNADLKRKAYVAVAAKMARVAHSLIKHDTDYRCYYESQ